MVGTSSNMPASGIDQRGEMHPEDGVTRSGLPTITVTSADDTSPAWSASLPVCTRRRSIPEQSEQQDPDDPTELDNGESEYPPSPLLSAENDGDDASLTSAEEQAAISDEMLGSAAGHIAKFREQMDKLAISFALTDAVLCFEQRQDDEAESRILHALELAKQFGEEASIALCIYWLARIEFHRGNDANAHRLFLDARPCIGAYDEGQEVTLFLSLYQRGVTGEDRVRILRSHVQEMLGKDTDEVFGPDEAVDADSPNEAHESKWKISAATGSEPERVRKRKPGELDSVDQVLHTIHTDKRGHIKSKQWLVRHNPDIYPRSEDDGRQNPDPNRQGPNWDMLWLKAANASSFRPQQGPFTFTMYPTGLAPRNRETEIFGEQRWEWIMPKTEWDDVQEEWKEKSVTMAFLTCERQELRQRAMRKHG